MTGAMPLWAATMAGLILSMFSDVFMIGMEIVRFNLFVVVATGGVFAVAYPAIGGAVVEHLPSHWLN
jgi:hypothetical protein